MSDHLQVTIGPACAGQRHDLSKASNAELARGRLNCGCLVDGKTAARVLNARRLADKAGSGEGEA